MIIYWSEKYNKYWSVKMTNKMLKTKASKDNDDQHSTDIYDISSDSFASQYSVHQITDSGIFFFFFFLEALDYLSLAFCYKPTRTKVIAFLHQFPSLPPSSSSKWGTQLAQWDSVMLLLTQGKFIRYRLCFVLWQKQSTTAMRLWIITLCSTLPAHSSATTQMLELKWCRNHFKLQSQF